MTKLNTNRRAYHEKIIERCQWRLENDATFKLEELKRGKIASRFLKLVYSFGSLETTDQSILKEYLETNDELNISKEAKNKKEATGKAVFELLSGKTQNPQRESLLDICALLVNLQPRPYDKNFDYTSLNIKTMDSNPLDNVQVEEEKDTHATIINIFNTHTSMKYFLIVVLCLTLVSVIAIWSFNKTNSQQGVTINTKNFTVSDINKITPNTNTQFFNKNNEPQVWYASYNNHLDFYNTAGIHPVTNKQLLPITKEVIKTVFVEKETLVNEKHNQNTEREATVSDVTKESSLLNSSIINTKQNKEISLFILDSINNIDRAFTNHLQQELTLQKYTVTPDLIIQSKLNSENIEHLQSGDFSYFKNELQNHTDFICIGSVKYSFNKSSEYEGIIICKMNIDFKVISSKSSEIIKSYSNVINGNGYTKSSAKQNTILKFKL